MACRVTLHFTVRQHNLQPSTASMDQTNPQNRVTQAHVCHFTSGQSVLIINNILLIEVSPWAANPITLQKCGKYSGLLVLVRTITMFFWVNLTFIIIWVRNCYRGFVLKMETWTCLEARLTHDFCVWSVHWSAPAWNMSTTLTIQSAWCFSSSQRGKSSTSTFPVVTNIWLWGQNRPFVHWW